MKITNLHTRGRNEWYCPEDGSVVHARPTGKAPNLKNFSGPFQYSPQHGEMLPHQELYTIYVNNEVRVRDIPEDDLYGVLRRMNYNIVR